MKEIHILNPAAGAKSAHLNRPKGIEIYETKGSHDLENYVTQICKDEPEIHITVYGGDGTVNEAVNGIIAAGERAMEKTVLSVVPNGSGNDFARNFAENEEYFGKIDVIKCNDRYCVNSINIGFDCDVIVETDKVKKNKLTSGSVGYVVGVIRVLSRKLGTDLDITLTDKNGEQKYFKGEYLLTAIGNGKYCGGGFMFAPCASLTDGLFDAMVIDKVSKPSFLKLVGDYRKGNHIDKNTCIVEDKYKNLLKYFQCREMTVKNISRVGIDGEVIYTDTAKISIVPSAINIKMPAFDLTKINSRKK